MYKPPGHISATAGTGLFYSVLKVDRRKETFKFDLYIVPVHRTYSEL